MQFKVRIFWKGHKIWKNLPPLIWCHSVASNLRWKIFFKFCAPLRISKLYIFGAILGNLIINFSSYSIFFYRVLDIFTEFEENVDHFTAAHVNFTNNIFSRIVSLNSAIFMTTWFDKFLGQKMRHFTRILRSNSIIVHIGEARNPDFSCLPFVLFENKLRI